MGAFWCSWAVQLCKSIRLRRLVTTFVNLGQNVMFKVRICKGAQLLSRCLGAGIFPGRGGAQLFIILLLLLLLLFSFFLNENNIKKYLNYIFPQYSFKVRIFFIFPSYFC